MGLPVLMARTDKSLRRIINRISPAAAVRIYSPGRRLFVNMLSAESTDGRLFDSEEFARTLWGIKFLTPLMNAAGMFKHGEGYEEAYRQGAGAWICGTTTNLPRRGNIKNHVKAPFISYPNSFSASNWCGLPNSGHAEVAKEIDKYSKHEGCPIGASIAADPDIDFDSAIDGMIRGLEIFSSTQADFAEVNVSCPNVKHFADEDDAENLTEKQLEIISERFLKTRKRNFPVIVKFSNDFPQEDVPGMIDRLVSYGFDGVNFGNTTTRYEIVRPMIAEKDLPAFDYFTKTYGGGASGRILRRRSYELCYSAMSSLKEIAPEREFHVIRAGGISTRGDIENSEHLGVAMNQWFTGYFEMFAKNGNRIYKEFFK